MAFPLLLAAAVGVDAYSKYSSSKANQRAAEAEATYQKQKSELEASRYERDAKRFRGKMAAVANKAGRPVSELTVADLIAEQFGEDELNAMIIRWGGENAAYNASQKAKQYGNQAVLGPLSTLLGGAYKMGFGTSSTPSVNLNYVGDINEGGYGAYS